MRRHAVQRHICNGDIMLQRHFCLATFCPRHFIQRYYYGDILTCNPGRYKNVVLLATKRFATLGTPVGVELSGYQRKIVGWWLLGCSGMVFGAVTLGGLTRLTESGLSMVDWRLIKGMKPPTSEEEWIMEFDKYKAYPEYEYKSAHKEMTLNEFKFIWSMEYFHRMWGRSIGLVFLLPATFFWFKGWFGKPMKKRMVVAGSLLIFQGLLGWYMVKSGLNPKSNSDSNVPRVSQYRLAAHLTAAFTLYAILLWCGLSHVVKQSDYTNIPRIGALRGLAHFSKTAMILTAIAGAFVSGMDAGLVHGTWPKYSGSWVPSDLWSKEMSWRNFTENPATVQFIHRNLGYLTLAALTVSWIVGRRFPLNPRTSKILTALVALGYVQVTLGIATLVHNVPVSMAAMHQNNFMILLTLVFWFSHELRRFPGKF